MKTTHEIQLNRCMASLGYRPIPDFILKFRICLAKPCNRTAVSVKHAHLNLKIRFLTTKDNLPSSVNHEVNYYRSMKTSAWLHGKHSPCFFREKTAWLIEERKMCTECKLVVIVICVWKWPLIAYWVFKLVSQLGSVCRPCKFIPMLEEELLISVHKSFVLLCFSTESSNLHVDMPLA